MPPKVIDLKMADFVVEYFGGYDEMVAYQISARKYVVVGNLHHEIFDAPHLEELRRRVTRHVVEKTGRRIQDMPGPRSGSHAAKLDKFSKLIK